MKNRIWILCGSIACAAVACGEESTDGTPMTLTTALPSVSGGSAAVPVAPVAAPGAGTGASPQNGGTPGVEANTGGAGGALAGGGNPGLAGAASNPPPPVPPGAPAGAGAAGTPGGAGAGGNGGSGGSGEAVGGGGQASGGSPVMGGAGAGGVPTAGPVPEVPESTLEGWPTEDGGTTGGGDATPVVVDSMDALNDAAGGSEPRVIHVSGKLSGGLKVGSNKTIIGMPGTEIRSGGNALNLGGSKNVIVKNITFFGKPNGGGDTVQISNGSHIWLDHVELVDGGDGQLDIVNGSNYITVSWSKFRYTEQTGHQNASLLGNSDGANDEGKIKVTFHHNWWAENVAERQPRVRFGQVHIYNSLYVATQGFTTYAIRAGYKANILSEKNVFRDFSGISKAAPDAKNDQGECLVFNYAFSKGDSILETVDDLFINCTERGIDADDTEGGTFGRGDAFTPPYQYTLDETATLEALIRKGAGPTLTP